MQIESLPETRHRQEAARAKASVPPAAAEHEDGHRGAGGAQSHAEEQERWPSLFDAAGEDVEVVPEESGKEGDGQENGGHRREPTVHHRQVLAGERGVQYQQGAAPLLDRGEAGHDLLQLAARRKVMRNPVV